MALAPPLAIDLTRLLHGALRSTPRGIDRVVLLYARHFFWSWPSDCFSVLGTPWGARAFTRVQAQHGVRAIDAFWGEKGPARPKLARRAAAGAELLRMPLAPGIPAERLPPHTLYLNVGQVGFSDSGAFDWLKSREDLRVIFMLHDLIPLQHPKLVAEPEYDGFRQILGTLARADGVILNSQAVATAYRQIPKSKKAQVLVHPLPIEPAFVAADRQTAPASPPYCVVCGQIEARKNQALLAEVWESLARDQASPFRLFVVGDHGAEAKELFRSIERWDPRHEHILDVRGVTTDRLCALLRGAVALLAPSLAEGFSLPVVEALTLGVPVLASDIPAHREVAGEHAVYLSPDDPSAWLGTLRSLRDEPAALSRLQEHARAYRPQPASDYFKAIDGFLRAVGQRNS